MKKLVLSVVLAALVVISLASGLTGAYFSDFDDTGRIVTQMAKLEIGQVATANLQFDGLYPGQKVSQSQAVSMAADSDTPADLYIGLQAISGKDVKDVLWVTIERKDGSTVLSKTKVTSLFANWVRVAQGVTGASGSQEYVITVELDASAGNSFQGATTTSKLLIYAAQQGQKPSGAPYDYTYNE